MKKISAVVISLIVLFSVSYGQNQNNHSVHKISQDLKEKISRIEFGDSIKVWIFFKSKGFEDRPSYKAAITDVSKRFSDKSIERRQKRVKREEKFDFHDLPVNDAYVESLENEGVEVLRRSRWLNAVSARISQDQLEILAELEFVRKIQKVATFYRKQEPENGKVDRLEKLPPSIINNIPDSVIDEYGQSYAQLDQLNVPILHLLGYTGEGIIITFLDTGFDIDHPALSHMNLIAKYDFISDDTSVSETSPYPDQPEHGTGTMSAVIGYAPDTLIGAAYNAGVILAKTEITAEEIEVEEDNWVAAVEWADSIGTDIVSSSLGYTQWYTYGELDGNTAVTTIAADIAVSRGIVVVNSAGNEGDLQEPLIIAPADGDSVIAVGAVDRFGQRVFFSSFGPTADGRIKPELMAMGIGVASAVPGNFYSFNKSGTSYSCPLIAGSVALMLQANPLWSPVNVRQALFRSADRFNSPDYLYGYGVPDIFKASDLLNIEVPSEFIASVDQAILINIETSGVLAADVDSFTVDNAPTTAELVNFGDGLAELTYTGRTEDIGVFDITITAWTGPASVSKVVSLMVRSGFELSFGPNPFRDSLVIYIGSQSAQVQEISIFTANGEKVWDDFTDSYIEEQAVVIWRAENDRGEKIAPGVYLIYVRTAESEKQFKVLKL